MKTLFLSLALSLVAAAASAQDQPATNPKTTNMASARAPDSAKLIIDGTSAYYQKTIKLDTSIGVGTIYVNALQFMAAKNFQQTYGYQEEGKLIFTTTQDLNIDPMTMGDDFQNLATFSVQFAITVDMKKQRYRYTIHNVVFYRPSDNGNLRVPLFDMYQKETSGSSKWVKRDAKKVMDSFERYISKLMDEMYESIEHKAAVYNPKF